MHKKISEAARKFVRKKSGKTARVHAIDLCIPIEYYKKVVNRTLNRRIKDNVRLNEEDLLRLIHFIDTVLKIINKELGSESKRRGKKIDPLKYDKLREFIGKHKNSETTRPEIEFYEGERTKNSVKPVKYRTNRTQ